MNETLFLLLGIQVTFWKIVGYTGVLMFGSRWLVQMVASRKANRPVVPRLFWMLSLCGSILCLLYFVFGKSDSVGVLAHLFPAAVSSYNLYLDITHHRNHSGI
ncbi:MAG: lipid-A-disaccharide synthase N-terminal domain-containing protein [Desulfatitalea sp.]|nr:lipid-A-disaccharide synthase N-terminal domain-containing protein [Desulfatitalea sp.]